MGASLKKVSILGTVGVPAAYGGFETLADNLVSYAQDQQASVCLSVYCSGKKNNYLVYKGANLRYINIRANGLSSILYDVLSIFHSYCKKDDVVLLLGVSGALALPFLRIVSNCKIVTNIDGVEWKRRKWGYLPRMFLRFSELVAVKFSHIVIADNQSIAEHVKRSYNRCCEVIAYGGDHAIVVESQLCGISLPKSYSLALCRIEPENNVEMILETFSQLKDFCLVFIGNWNSSEFGRAMNKKYHNFENIYLIDPIYESGVLKSIRSNAESYIHGHSAGGTNPSLVEMMHFGCPVFAFDCSFNRYSTEDKAIFFSSSEELVKELEKDDEIRFLNCGGDMKRIATARYTWKKIGKDYFKVILSV